MGFFKGLANFVIMLVLGLCLFAWLSYALLGNSLLSLDENQNMMSETQFTEEVTDAMLEKYHTSLNELSFDKEVLLKVVNEAGSGVLGYVLLEYDQMPNLDVAFLKDYVIDAINTESFNRMEGNIDVGSMISALREVPEGNSISSTLKSYTKSLDLDINQSEIDNVANVFLENKDLDDESLTKMIVTEITNEVLNLDEMNTNLSMQDLFDRLMARNPFTVIRSVMSVVEKDLNGYLPLMMIILILIILVIEFRVGSASIWLALSLIIAIIPLQLLRLADFFIQKDILNIVNGMESYKNYMMDAIINKLNVYTIIVVVIIVILFILSIVFRKRVDAKTGNVENKSVSRFILVRLAIFAVLVFGLYLNGNAAKKYNMTLYNDINTIKPSDFDPQSIDLTLRELLNIDFDF